MNEDAKQAEFRSALVGRTIQGLRLEDHESEGEDFERLVLETDRGPVTLRSQDYEGYRSWIVLDEVA